MNPVVLIIASNVEEHFMPLSTKERPNQLLNLFSDLNILHQTVDRLLTFIDSTKIFIITNITQSTAITKELPHIPERNIIIQPSNKGSAAAIGYGSLYVNECFPDSDIIVLNTHQLLSEDDCLTDAFFTRINDINLNEIIVAIGDQPSLSLQGIYIFKFNTLLKEYGEYLPNHFQILMEVQPYIQAGLYGEVLADEISLYFEALEIVPIQYGIMEHTKIIKCISTKDVSNDQKNVNTRDNKYAQEKNRTSILD